MGTQNQKETTTQTLHDKYLDDGDDNTSCPPECPYCLNHRLKMNLEAVTENLGNSYERETKAREETARARQEVIQVEALLDRRDEGHRELIRELHDERLAMGTLRDRILNLNAEVEYVRKALALANVKVGQQQDQITEYTIANESLRDQLKAERDDNNSPGVCAYGMCQVVIFDSAKYCDRHEADIAMGLVDDG